MAMRQLRRFLAGELPSSFLRQAGQPLHGTVRHGCRRCFCAQSGGPNAGRQTAGLFRQGGLSWLTVGVTLSSALGVYAYLQYQMQQVKAEKLKEQEKSVGVAQIGGPFTLYDTAGKKFTDEDLKGNFAILYFGFTNCPDICPDELEKMGAALNIVEKRASCAVRPVFISIDPERDTAASIKAYVAEFHPRMIGLRAPMDEVKAVAKKYRVYFMKTNDSKDDYLVDHSIIMYLLDPEGKFVTFYGKNFTADQIADSLCEHIRNWKKGHPDWKP